MYATASCEWHHLHRSRNQNKNPKQNKTKQTAVTAGPKPAPLPEDQRCIRPDTATAMPSTLPQALSYIGP